MNWGERVLREGSLETRPEVWPKDLSRLISVQGVDAGAVDLFTGGFGVRTVLFKVS